MSRRQSTYTGLLRPEVSVNGSSGRTSTAPVSRRMRAASDMAAPLRGPALSLCEVPRVNRSESPHDNVDQFGDGGCQDRRKHRKDAQRGNAHGVACWLHVDADRPLPAEALA